MKYHCLIFLLLLIITPLAAKDEHVDVILALSWLGGYCQNISNDCDPDKLSLWDHQSFTIRGIQVSLTNSPSIGSFDINFLTQALYDQMYNYWPPSIKLYDYYLASWDSQFQKSGKDFAAAILQLNSNAYSTDQWQRNVDLQIAYFQTVIDTYKTLKARKVQGGLYNKKKLASTLGIKETQFYTDCSKQTGDLLQVRVCYKLTKKGLERETCHFPSNTCTSSYKLKDWAASKQTSVFAVPIVIPHHHQLQI